MFPAIDIPKSSLIFGWLVPQMAALRSVGLCSYEVRYGILRTYVVTNIRINNTKLYTDPGKRKGKERKKEMYGP